MKNCGECEHYLTREGEEYCTEQIEFNTMLAYLDGLTDEVPKLIRPVTKCRDFRKKKSDSRKTKWGRK